MNHRRVLPIKSLIVKKSVRINDRHSSVSLEGAFWNAVKRRDSDCRRLRGA